MPTQGVKASKALKQDTQKREFFEFGQAVSTITVAAPVLQNLKNDEPDTYTYYQTMHAENEAQATRLNIKDFPVFSVVDGDINTKVTLLVIAQHKEMLPFYNFGFVLKKLEILLAPIEGGVAVSTEIDREIKRAFNDCEKYLQSLLPQCSNLLDRICVLKNDYSTSSQTGISGKIIALNNLIKQELAQKPPQRQERYSEVDPSRIVTDTHWLISLARKPDGTSDEHAFLVLEGKEENTARIWFMDLVGNPVLSGVGDGKIRMKAFEGPLDDKLLLSCKLRMMDIYRDSRLLSTSWTVPREAALQLVTSIEEQQPTPPKFNILGRASVFASSTAGSSSKSVGHNCFTWAREQLHALNQPSIGLGDKDSVADYVFSRTSRVLPDAQMLSWYQRPIGVASIAATGVAVGAAIAGKKCIIL